MRSPPRLPALGLAAMLGGHDVAAPVEAPVYCYRTLADVACYLEPDRGREGRLVGIYRRPAPPAEADPAPRRGAGSR